jgi:Toastrack DUF4097
MTSIVGERHAVITHDIGPAGRLILRTVRGSVHVRGVDGTEVRVEARYSLPASGPGSEADIDQILNVHRAERELRVEVDDTDGMLGALGRLFGLGRSSVDFEVTLPRDASLQVGGVSASLDVDDIHGGLDLRTVSGGVSISGADGRISLQSVSGDVLLQAGHIELDATTTSGDLSASVHRFDRVTARSVSGDLRLTGELAPGFEHTLESISGDVELSPANGVTVKMASLSGSLRSDLPHRRDSRAGRRIVVVGDGVSSLSFRSMSGDMRIVGGKNVLQRPTGPAPGPEPQADAAATTSLPAGPPEAPVAEPATTADQLSVLRALERGELDVETAARLLEEHRHAG